MQETATPDNLPPTKQSSQNPNPSMPPILETNSTDSYDDVFIDQLPHIPSHVPTLGELGPALSTIQEGDSTFNTPGTSARMSTIENSTARTKLLIQS